MFNEVFSSTFISFVEKSKAAVKMASFAKLPSSTDTNVIKPFEVSIPESTLSDMKTLIKLSRIAVPSYENTHTKKDNDDHFFGIDREFIVNAKKVWENEYDW